MSQHVTRRDISWYVALPTTGFSGAKMITGDPGPTIQKVALSLSEFHRTTLIDSVHSKNEPHVHGIGGNTCQKYFFKTVALVPPSVANVPYHLYQQLQMLNFFSGTLCAHNHLSWPVEQYRPN